MNVVPFSRWGDIGIGEAAHTTTHHFQINFGWWFADTMAVTYSASSLVRPLFKYLANGDVFSYKSGTIDGGMLKICMDLEQ